jgi:hypothetical protein
MDGESGMWVLFSMFLCRKDLVKNMICNIL